MVDQIDQIGTDYVFFLGVSLKKVCSVFCKPYIHYCQVHAEQNAVKDMTDVCNA